MKPKELAALLFLAALWGASFLFIKVAVARPETPLNFGPLTLVSVRLGLAGLVLYGILHARKMQFPWHHWRRFAVLGLINAALPYFLFSWGEQRVNSNLAAIYNASTPLWTVVLALLFVRTERLSLLRSIGVILGFFGVVYLFTENSSRSAQINLAGQIACLIAGVCYAFGNMWVRLRLRDQHPLALASGQLMWGAFWVIPLSLLFEHPWTIRPTLAADGALLMLSLCGTALALLVYFWLLGRVGATRTAQVTYLLPIFGLFWGQLIGEPVTSRIAGALLIILAGSIIMNGGLGWIRSYWRPSPS